MKSALILKLGLFHLVVALMVQCSGDRKISNEGRAEIHDSVYLDAGNRITTATFDSLRNTLLDAVRKTGFDSAVGFCKIQAIPLTATYSDSVTIRRVTSRYRNPLNAPDELEQRVLTEFEKSKTDTLPAPVIIRDDSTNRVHFFKPIIVQAFCLNCHGNVVTDIQSGTLTRIRELYPEDKAVDYSENDLRGVWHITFAPTVEP